MQYHSLLQKQAAGTATEAELQQLQQWLQTLDEAALRQVMHSYALLMNTERLQATPGNAAVWRQINATLQQQGALPQTSAPGIPSVTESRRVRTLWPRVSVAAAVLLALVSGTWWWMNRGAVEPAEVRTLAIAGDKAPAVNRATLTLADGRVITLDSAAGGTLAQQQGMAVVKLSDGAIRYQPNGTTSAGNAAAAVNTLRTPRGGLFQVTLPDGSRVWLNSASSLQYPAAFTGTNRTVTLSGEAYFEIAADKSKPFLVNTATQQVQVLGTAFNINAYDDEGATRTTLLQGSVQVALHTPGNGAAQQKLSPGKQAVATPAGITVQQPDLQQVMAWKEGEFRFSHLKITSIMRQIARWYDVEVEYQGPVPQNEFYGVIPRKEYVSQILKALTLTKNVHFVMKGNTIVVIAGPA